MSALPRVAESTREQIAREFDDLGPDACIAEISEHLRDNNPEWLYMASFQSREIPWRWVHGGWGWHRHRIFGPVETGWHRRWEP